MKRLFVSALLVNLLVACSTQQPKVAVEEPKPTAVVESPKPVAEMPVAPPSEVKAQPAVVTPPVAVDPLNDPSSILAKRSVYYPFDVYVVQDADKPVVQAHAGYLSTHASRKVRLEGNCDERGSNEYNLALGQRRADGVKKMLEVGGVKDNQIVTVSYGEEKPKMACHEERCWKENRRTDLNYSY